MGVKENSMSSNEDSVPTGKPVAAREVIHRSSYPSVDDLLGEEIGDFWGEIEAKLWRLPYNQSINHPTPYT